MKKIKRISTSLIIGIVLVLLIATPVFAIPANVTGFIANPSSTSIILSWQPATGATSYLVRYRTDTYPTGTADGTLVYSSNQTMVTLSGLTAGATYYFSLWGYDGASYSANATNLASTTLAIAIPSGGQVYPSNVIPIPTIPANATQTPSIGSFNLQPFTNIFSYANNASLGGLGMPIANLWETIAVIIIVLLGLFTYVKLKNFFVAYFVVVVASAICVGLHLLQGYILPAELVIGAGVWGLERFFQ